MRKIIATVIGILTVLITFAFATPASAVVGPYHICTLNGSNNCIGDTGLNIGDHLQQFSNANARNMFVDFIDNSCGPSPCAREYLKFYNGYYMASTDACNGNVVVKGTGATTGIVWTAVFHTGNPSYTDFYNQHCSGAHLGADNIIPHEWQLDPDDLTGIYYKINGVISG